MFSISKAQYKSTYVDISKKDTVTVNVIAENKRQAATNNSVYLQLVRAVENQTLINSNLADAINSFGKDLSAYTKEIEKRNKSDGKLITDVFNYSKDDVALILKKENWLHLGATLFALGYLLLYILRNSPLFGEYTTSSSIIRFIINIGLTILLYFVILNLATLIFNGDYYVIKELTNLYS